MKKLVILLCALSLAGCAVAWEGGFKAVPEESDETMVTYKFDSVSANMKKMKQDANRYCRDRGFKRAERTEMNPSMWSLATVVYECE